MQDSADRSYSHLHRTITMWCSLSCSVSHHDIQLTEDGSLDGIFLSREDTPVDVVKFYKQYGYEVTSVPILGGSYRSFG